MPSCADTVMRLIASLFTSRSADSITFFCSAAIDGTIPGMGRAISFADTDALNRAIGRYLAESETRLTGKEWHFCALKWT